MTHREPLVAVPLRPGMEQATGATLSERNFAKILECVRVAGMSPVLVTLDTDLTGFSGIVIPGGADLSPARYGEPASDKAYGVNDDQDALDLALVSHARLHDLPLLGICRGAQAANVALGGTLYVDLDGGVGTHHNSIGTGAQDDVFVSHDVEIDANSRTADALPTSAMADSAPGTERIVVRSAHHQGIKDLGAGLSAVAHARDGLIEAFEGDTGWLLAVQWHPEAELEEGELKHGLFRALASEIARRDSLTHSEPVGA